MDSTKNKRRRGIVRSTQLADARILRSRMALIQMVGSVVRVKVVVFRRSSMVLPHSSSRGVAPWGHCCLLTCLTKRGAEL